MVRPPRGAASGPPSAPGLPNEQRHETSPCRGPTGRLGSARASATGSPPGGEASAAGRFALWSSKALVYLINSLAIKLYHEQTNFWGCEASLSCVQRTAT